MNPAWNWTSQSWDEPAPSFPPCREQRVGVGQSKTTEKKPGKQSPLFVNLRTIAINITIINV